jgi:hypothetical protein
MMSTVLVFALAACSSAGAQPQPQSPSQSSQVGGPSPTSSEPDWPEPATVAHDEVTVGYGPHRLSFADGAVWVASQIGDVYRVGPDDAAGRVVAGVGSGVPAATVASGRLFAGDNRHSRVLVYDLASRVRQRSLPMPGPVRGLLSALGSIWVTAGDSVVQLDPTTLRRTSVTVVGGEAAQIAAAGDVVVITNRGIPQVTALDTAGRVVGVAEVGGPTIGVVVIETQIWALHSDRPVATRLSRERFSPIDELPLPGVSYDAAIVGQEIWATLSDEGTVARISKDGTVLGQFPVGSKPLGIASGAGWVWVANEGDSSLWRLSASLATVGT